ncbi:hypothetical protein EBT25_12450 [bacterium]|nr:hypothetical protein [bacterium]
MSDFSPAAHWSSSMTEQFMENISNEEHERLLLLCGHGRLYMFCLLLKQNVLKNNFNFLFTNNND